MLLFKTLINGCPILSGYDCWCFLGFSIIDPDDTVWRNFKLEWVNVKRRQKKYIGLCVIDMLLCKTLINGCPVLSGYDCWCFVGGFYHRSRRHCLEKF